MTTPREAARQYERAAVDQARKGDMRKALVYWRNARRIEERIASNQRMIKARRGPFLDEGIAKRAEAQVRKQYPNLGPDNDRFWALKMHIYKQMGGTTSKGVFSSIVATMRARGETLSKAEEEDSYFEEDEEEEDEEEEEEE